MAVIDFLPDRLNTPPVVWRGFTSDEFLLAAGAGCVVGVPVAIPLAFIPFFGWLAFPTCMLLMPLVMLFLGGRWISSYKRGKPENYIWRRLEEVRCQFRLKKSTLILVSRSWEMQRTRPFASRRSR